MYAFVSEWATFCVYPARTGGGVRSDNTLEFSTLDAFVEVRALLKYGKCFNYEAS